MNLSNGDKHHGPHLGIVSSVFVALFVGSLIVLGVLTKGVFYPRPDWPGRFGKGLF